MNVNPMDDKKRVQFLNGEKVVDSILFKTLPEKGDIITIRGEKFILSSHAIGFINEPGVLYAQVEPAGTSSFVGNKSQLPKAATMIMNFLIGVIAGYMLGMIVAGFIGGWYE